MTIDMSYILMQGSDDKSEKADKKTKEKKKTPDNAPQEIPADEAMPETEVISSLETTVRNFNFHTCSE